MAEPQGSERRGEQILEQLEAIAAENGRNISRRLAADLAQLPVDERAFAKAFALADATYRVVFQPRVYADEADRERLHVEAKWEAAHVLVLGYLTALGGVS